MRFRLLDQVVVIQKKNFMLSGEVRSKCHRTTNRYGYLAFRKQLTKSLVPSDIARRITRQTLENSQRDRFCWNLRDIKYIDIWTYRPHIRILIVLLQSLFSSFHIHSRTIYIVERDLLLSLSRFTINTTEVRYSLLFYSYILNLHLLQSLLQVFNNISCFTINTTESLVQTPMLQKTSIHPRPTQGQMVPLVDYASIISSFAFRSFGPL